MRYILLFACLVLVVYVASQYVRTQQFISKGRQMSLGAVRFERALENAPLRILIIGDSTGVGTGASAPEYSLAGLVGARYPAASIQNISVNGARIAGTIEQLETADERYDLILIHTGGNDVVRFTPYKKIQTDFDDLLALAVQKSDRVLITSTGNIGTVRLFPAPLRPVFERRFLHVRDMMIASIETAGGSVRYTDLYRTKENDPFYLQPDLYFAEDQFHPSDTGYADWFQFMKKELEAFGV